MKEGKLIVVSGPSGVGKDTIVNKYLEKHSEDELSISMTSRPIRDGEVNGVNYYFKTKEEFEEAIKNNEMLEFALYNGNYYGTPKAEVEERIKNGINVILVIEVVGAMNVKNIMGDKCTLIFIMPPSMEVLKNRLMNRGTDSKESIEGRLDIAKKEIGISDKYDFIIINDNLEKAVRDLENVIKNNIN
ncbi:MAG: guanylate kinase [Bacilli bacterium]|nr:guanylate kinase [Bacilli bacterium]